MAAPTNADRTGHGFAYQPALDGLRAVAVIAVILYHLDATWMPGGFLGVDTFFVLSGYLITSLLLVEHAETGTVSLRAFWVRRAKRLLPAALLVLFAVAMYAWLVAPTDQLSTIRGDALATLAYVANWRFILDDASYFELWSEASPLRHMWSLAIEEQFYVVWPAAVLGLLAAARGQTRLLVWACGLGVVGSTMLMAALAELDRSRAYFGTDTRAHTILVGALLAVALRSTEPSPRATRLLNAGGLAGGAAMLAAFVFVSDTALGFYRGGSLVFALCAAVVIAAGVGTTDAPVRRVLDRRPLRAIGHLSYGLYLWHWPIIVWFTPDRVGVDGFVLDAARILATFGAALLSYLFVEQPIRRSRPSVRVVGAVVPAAMAVAAAVIMAGTVGATTNPLDREPEFTIVVAAPTSTTTIDPAPQPSTATDEVTTTAPPTTVPVEKPFASPVRSVALIGDSVAGSLAPAFGRAVTDAGLTFLDAHVHGCGVASGLTVTDAGELFPWSEDCLTRVPEIHEQLIADHNPDLIVWHSTWETADRRVDGEFVEFGTPEHAVALTDTFNAVADRLTKRGGRIVVLLAPPNAPNDFIAEPDPSDMQELAELLRTAATNRDDVSIIDLTPVVCPGGPPCPTDVDGLTLRPDGGHYVDASAAWVVDQIFSELIADA